LKAIAWRRYGPPEVLEVTERPKPVPKENEVLIKIKATTVETGDTELRRFQIPVLFWIPLRLVMGIVAPRKGKGLGQQVAGIVEHVGKGVSAFKPGDEVLANTGMVFNGYAEYICLPESYPIVHKPATVDWAEAAALSVGGLNALHFVRLANIRRGQSMLIYGGTGAIGSFAVQLAKHNGAKVTAVCSTEKTAFATSLGADHTIDYSRTRFYDTGQHWDVILDTIGGSPYEQCIRSLTPNGTYLLANPRARDMIRAWWTSKMTDKTVRVKMAGTGKNDLKLLRDMLARGELRSVVDNRRFALQTIVEAHRYVETRRKFGNVVVIL